MASPLPGSFPVASNDHLLQEGTDACSPNDAAPVPSSSSSSSEAHVSEKVDGDAPAAATPAAGNNSNSNSDSDSKKNDGSTAGKKKRKLVRVLSIDGGGVRGIIPAVVLSYIERRTHRRICDLFDLVCGTSTGALLATILSIPDPEKSNRPKYTASQCVSLYEKECSKIFSRTLMGNLTSGWGLFDIAYSTKGRNEVYQKYVGDLPLSSMLTDLLITAYDMKERRPFFFKSRSAKESETFDYPMKIVLQSTSAAPTYFEPTRVEYRPSAYIAPSTSPYTMIDKWGNEEMELNSARELVQPTPRKFSQTPRPPFDPNDPMLSSHHHESEHENDPPKLNIKASEGSDGSPSASAPAADDAHSVLPATQAVTSAAAAAEAAAENATMTASESHVRRTDTAQFTSTTTMKATDGEIIETKTTTQVRLVLEETQDITTTTTIRSAAAKESTGVAAAKPPPSSDRYRCLIDGGTFANNPAMCGLAEALRHYKEEDTDVLVVSLGTGTCYSPYSYEEAKSWGMIGWARPILDIMLDGQANTVDYQLNQLLGADGLYYRFDTFIAAANSSLDDSRDINMAYLRSKGEEIVENRREELDRVCELLMQDDRLCTKPLGRFWWEHSFPSELEEQDAWSLIP